MTICDGTSRVVLQCMRCGRASEQMKMASYDVAALPLFDEKLRDDFANSARKQERIRIQCEAELGERRKADYFWDAYNAYLRSDRWREKRQAVMGRAKGLCEARLEGCEDFAAQVHHLTYDHCPAKHADFEEPIWELRAVCERCHKRLTEMSRGDHNV